MSASRVQPRHDPAASRVTRGTRRMPKLPYVVSRVFFVLAGLMVAEELFPSSGWLGILVDGASTLFLPIDDGDLGLAVVALIVGAGLARRKRLAWVATVVTLSVVVLVELVSIVSLVLTWVAGQNHVPVLVRVGSNVVLLTLWLVVLIVYRREFTARRQPGNLRRALLTLALGLGVTFTLGIVLTGVFPGRLDGPRGRLAWLLERTGTTVFGDRTPQAWRPVDAPPDWISVLVGLLVGVTLVVSLLVLMRSQRQAALMSFADEQRVRELVAASPEDSLAYFETRRDKSVVFAVGGRGTGSGSVAIATSTSTS